MNSDKVRYLKEVEPGYTTPPTKKERWKQEQDRLKNEEEQESWSTVDLSKVDNDIPLPFMSQLTTATDHVTLKKEEPEQQETSRNEQRTEDREAIRTQNVRNDLGGSEDDREVNVPGPLRQLAKYLEKSTAFHNCTFSFTFER